MTSSTTLIVWKFKLANWKTWQSESTTSCSLFHRCLTHRANSLATETEYVRGRLAQYGNDLLSLGVDGMRLDAAKRKPFGSFAGLTPVNIYLLSMSA